MIANHTLKTGVRHAQDERETGTNHPLYRDFHVAPVDAPTGRGHKATFGCWCGPIASFRELDTGARVYRHRTPPVERRQRTEPTRW